MTTIAADLDAGCMAADGRAGGDDTPAFTTQKIFQAEGWLLGVAGSLTDALKCVKWIQAGCPEKSLPDIDKNEQAMFNVLMMSREGLFLMDNDLIPIQIKERKFAIGSGANIALAMLLNNHTPHEAVQQAAVLDRNTGEPFDIQFLPHVRTHSTSPRKRKPSR